MRLEVGRARVIVTERADDGLDRECKTAKQVHGSRVVVVDASTADVGEADGLVTAEPGLAVGVRTADCAPVLLIADGVVGAIHAGWRGLLAGVVEEGVAAMRGLGATSMAAVLGPAIGPECYEFSPADLDALAAVYGDGVRGVTSAGAPALDVLAGVRVALERSGVTEITDLGGCTACDPDRWYSHRARGEAERMTSAVS
ncbi:MAG: purine-nucleoside/S-methyl-5-thioadenosine phosphorylase / adenosine deaminase, partial [Actinomycetota bacterium]|nr:purine-nucleoside/S-methyl-5-thioadenosine phosphorylase / adenosine deaminase [Actinomycetota bacterium]